MLGLRIALSLIRVYGGRKLKTEIFRPSHRHQSRSRLDLARLAHHDNFRMPLQPIAEMLPQPRPVIHQNRARHPPGTVAPAASPPFRKPERDLRSPIKPPSAQAHVSRASRPCLRPCPLRSSSRRLWTAGSITALSACGARLPVLPTRPPPNKPHLKFQISNLKSPHRAAGSGLL